MMTHRNGPQPGKQLVVRALSGDARRGIVVCGGLGVPCALGRSGRRVGKREGDGATPIGRFALREVFYRGDRVARPCTRLPVTALKVSDGWCDDPCDRNYNRRVRHPYSASAERLWRDDHLYDLVVVLGYDDSLDVFGVHAIGGIIGALLTGVFAVQAIGGTAGVLEGNFAQLPIQAYGVMCTIVWDLVATFVILLVLRLTIGIRVSEAAEVEGLDLALHGETVQ